jgi:hypothetical protein
MIDEKTAGPADPHAEVPDWDAVGHDLACPLCDYNLRGLQEPRCPECGHRFAWRDLTDPRRRKHPWLFEHHPDRNLWSFWKTARGGLRPLRFWSSLSPAQPSRPRRLVLYWCIAATIGLLGPASPYLAVWGQSALRARQAPAPYQYLARLPAGGVRWVTTTRAPPPALDLEDAFEIVGPGYLASAAWAVAWPWFTCLTLMVFRVSMRRARVKTVHVLRCVVYSSDPMIWAGIAMLALTGFALAADGAISEQQFIGLSEALLAGLYLIVVTKLGAAYARYLRFDRPWATVIASQIVFALLVLNQCELTWGTVTRLLEKLLY